MDARDTQITKANVFLKIQSWNDFQLIPGWIIIAHGAQISNSIDI